MQHRGRMLLVGAGPGATDLLTVRAVRAIKTARIVLIGALVSHEVRALIPRSAKVINVGKRGHKRSTSQELINRLMARLAPPQTRARRPESLALAREDQESRRRTCW
jgi:siroheme synthase